MDHIDRCIVDILQKNARTPVKVIASEVDLSSPAVCARIERLEKSGVLTGYQAQVSGPAVGYLVKAFINLEVEPDQKPDFFSYIEACRHVVECNCVTGDYSMLIEVCFHTTQELDQFVSALQKYGRTKTQIVFSTYVEHRGIMLAPEDSMPGAEASSKKSKRKHAAAEEPAPAEEK